MRLRIIDDLEGDFAVSDFTLGDGDPIRDLAIVAADFNGDGTAQIALGVGFDEGAELRFLDASDDYTADDSLTQSYGVSFEDRTSITLELAAGNLDYDNPAELALVVNELSTDFNGRITGASTLYLYDDGVEGHALIEEGPVQGRDGQVLTAVVADVDLGDVDGDGLDELVLGGLEEFPHEL